MGVLFVHGIGDQSRGTTLVEFGTPLFEWLAERASAAGGSARLVSGQLLPSPGEDVPAHAEIHLEVGGQVRRWLIAEAWWAESFRSPRFANLARWGFAVVPWTFGSHFGARLVRMWRSRGDRGWARIAGLGRILSAFLALLGGMILSLGMLLVLAALLVVGLIPWQRLRSAIVAIQVRMASSLGDSYVLVTRPIESAALLSRFRHDLGWLSRRCGRTAVVAHSQGGAVACRALSSAGRSEAEMLLTFGSGLRKLEELEELSARPQFKRGAGVTLLGLFLVGLSAAAGAARPPTLSGDLAVLLGYAAVGLALLAAGIRDFLGGPEPASVMSLAEHFRQIGVRWRDLFASADPVPNGRLHEHRRLPPASVPVVNLGSMLHDHNSYWSNRDEFVTRVANALLELDPALRELRLSPKAVKFLRKRRSKRVRLLRIAWWIAFGSVAALVVRYWSDWIAIAGWAARRVAAWGQGLGGNEVAPIPLPPAGTWARSVGWAALVLAGYAAVRWAWSRWNGREMAVLPPRKSSGDPSYAFVVALAFQLVAAGSAIAGTFAPWTVAVALLSAIVVTLAISKLSPPPGIFEDKPEPPTGPQSQAESTGRFLWNLFSAVVMIVSIPSVAFLAVRWLATWLAGWIGDVWWRWPLAAALLALGLLAFSSAVVGIISFLQSRWKRDAPAPGDPGSGESP